MARTAARVTASRSSGAAASSLARQSLLRGRGFVLVEAVGENVFEERVVLEAAKELSPFSPVDADGDGLVGAAFEERFQERGDLAGREGFGALAGEEFADFLVAGNVAFAAEDAPVDREGGEAEGAAVMGEGVEIGVRGGVVALGGIAEDAGDGREEDERVERAVLRGVVEVPRAVGLGLEHGGHAGGSQVHDRGVVDGHGEVENALERRLDRVDELGRVGGGADVELLDLGS